MMKSSTYRGYTIAITRNKEAPGFVVKVTTPNGHTIFDEAFTERGAMGIAKSIIDQDIANAK